MNKEKLVMIDPGWPTRSRLSRGGNATNSIDAKVYCEEGEMMFNKARIEKGLYWDEAWSLVSGCTPVSEGCQNCWSTRVTHMRAEHPNEKVRARNIGLTENGRFNGQIRLNYEFLDKPLRKKKPTTYAIWNDLFHEDVPFVFIHRVWDTMKACPQHTFIVLTKRPYRMLAFTQWMAGGDDISIAEWPRNCWLGVTAENQQRADERIPVLLQIPAAVRFVSIEPMLGPIDLTKLIIPITGPGSSQPCAPETWRQINALTGDDYQYDWKCHGVGHQGPQLNWVICGGETGPGARPMHPDWARRLRDQCQSAGMPFFFKQWGEYCSPSQMPPDTFREWDIQHGTEIWDDEPRWRVGKKAAGRILDGRMWDEMPEN